MSGVLGWWQERLRDRSPVGPAFRNAAWMKTQTDGWDDWPVRVARQAMYLDYQGYFKAHYDEFPKGIYYASELVFFSQMSPLLYLSDKKEMVKNFHVMEQRQINGEWRAVKVRRWFVMLKSWDEHVAAFKRETGLEV